MTLSYLIVIATPRAKKKKWPPDPVIIMVVIATHVIKRHNASVNDIHRFSRISAKREQVEVQRIYAPFRMPYTGSLCRTLKYKCMYAQSICFLCMAYGIFERNVNPLYCVLPDPCAGVPEVPGAGYAILPENINYMPESKEQ